MKKTRRVYVVSTGKFIMYTLGPFSIPITCMLDHHMHVLVCIHVLLLFNILLLLLRCPSSQNLEFFILLLPYSSQFPLGGFCNLVGATGLCKFTISRIEYTPNKLQCSSGQHMVNGNG